MKKKCIVFNLFVILSSFAMEDKKSVWPLVVEDFINPQVIEVQGEGEKIERCIRPALSRDIVLAILHNAFDIPESIESDWFKQSKIPVVQTLPGNADELISIAIHPTQDDFALITQGASGREVLFYLRQDSEFLCSQQEKDPCFVPKKLIYHGDNQLVAYGENNKKKLWVKDESGLWLLTEADQKMLTSVSPSMHITYEHISDTTPRLQILDAHQNEIKEITNVTHFAANNNTLITIAESSGTDVWRSRNWAAYVWDMSQVHAIGAILADAETNPYVRVLVSKIAEKQEHQNILEPLQLSQEESELSDLLSVEQQGAIQHLL